jgi:metallophosphoesterase (TIGR00282 family)
MKILFLGDIVGKPGRAALAETLPDLRLEYKPDAVIVNGENATHGKGINKSAYNFFMEKGVDVVTSGDHAFDLAEVNEVYEQVDCQLLRPANYPNQKETPGNGYIIIDTPAGKLGVINLQGRVFMREGMDSPFKVVDDILSKPEIKDIPIFVDFHTEATSEIAAMGWYLDGRVSAVVGTHTHVQTADARILPKGTAFISDVGMCGPRDSILGVDKNIILKKFLTAMPLKHELAEMPAIVNAVIVDTASNSIETISKVVKEG